MRETLLLCAIIGFAIADPLGSYHQEYSYKSSSSSFKNNELQHKTDDQGYYKKDGDLDGRTRPRVDANSEHSEYVNPNLRSGSQYAYGDNSDMNSYGLMHASNGVDSYGTNQLAESIASSDRIVGNRAYTASSGYGDNYGSASNYDSGTYGSGTYGSGTYGNSRYTGSYGSTASIQSIVQRLQQDFERDLQNYRWRQANSQAVIDQAELERQLKQNLTERLSSELTGRYGQQVIRNGMSYSITDGRIQPVANYNQQELDNLKLQMENNILNSLRTQYNQGYYGTSSGSSSHYESDSHSKYGYTSPTVRPTGIYPSLPIYSTTQKSTYASNSHSDYEVISSNTRYTPVVSPESISTIASSVQSQLDSSLNRLLDDIYRKYFSSSTSYQATNYDVVLNRIQNDLKNNITYLIDDNLRRNYGSQIQRDGYLYSIGPSGQPSNTHNYALRDLDALKAQIERNLIEKLKREFNTYRTRYTSQHQSYSGSSSYNSYDQYSTTPRYYTTSYTTPRAQYISSGVQDYSGSSYGSGYSGSSYGSGSSYSGGSYSSSSTSLDQLQRQLQDDLSRQLQAAIRRDHSSYSSSGSYSPQNYQSSLQHLTDELNRNVTRHLQEFSASASYSASGNYDQAQIDNIKSELLSSLTRQLQQNLQKDFQSSSSSYSAGSSSNYRPARGSNNYEQGQYRSGGSVTIAGEDCDHGIIGYRMKRSLHTPYRSRPLSHYHHGYTDNNHYGYSGIYRSSIVPHQPREREQTGQEVDDSVITQQEELGQEIEEVDISHYQSLLPKPQKMQEDVGQQVEDQFEDLHVGQETQTNDESQQHVEEELGDLHISQQTELGQQIDDDDLTQQTENQNFEIPSPLHEIGQQVDNTALNMGGLLNNQAHLNAHLPQAQIRDGAAKQSEEYDSFQVGQHVELDVGQEPENSYLPGVKPVQFIPQKDQVSTGSYGIPGNPNLVQEDLVNSDSENIEPLQTGQQVDDSDLSYTQHSQTGYSRFPAQNSFRPMIPQTANIQGSIPRTPIPSSQIHQEMDNSYLTQQNEEFKPLQSGQQIYDTDMTSIQNTGNVYTITTGENQIGLLRPQSAQETHPSEDTLGQELENSDLSQQEFKPFQTEENVDFIDVSHVTPGRTYTLPTQKPSYIVPNPNNYQRWTPENTQTNPQHPLRATQEHSINTPSTTGVREVLPLSYWNSRHWQPRQDIFIRSNRVILVKKLNEALENGKISTYQKEMVLKEISANITKEISSYQSSYLMNFLGLTEEDIEGIKSILYEDLRVHYEDKIKNPKKQSASGISNVQTNYPTSPISHQDYSKFSQKQQTFIRVVEYGLIRDLRGFVDDKHSKNYGPEQMNEEFKQMVKKRFRKYNDYFLTSYIGFKPAEISEIESILIKHLRTEWLSQRNTEITSQKTYSEESSVYPQNENGDQQTVSENELTSEAFSQTNVEQIIDQSQSLENSFVNHLNQPNHYGLSNNAQGSPNEQREVPTNYGSGNSFNSYYGTSQFSSGYGSSYLHPKKITKLSDSSGFINAELDHQKNIGQSGVHFSPTLNKVLAEEQTRTATGLENNTPSSFQPGNIPQQSGNSLASDGVVRVPLEKSIGTSYGLPHQSQISSEQAVLLAQELIEKQKQKPTKPIAKVVDQQETQFPSNVRTEENSGYHLGQQSIDSSLLFSHHDDDFYEGKHNSGVQKIQPVVSPNKQEAGFNSADLSSLFSQHGDNFYERQYNSGVQTIEPLVGSTSEGSNSDAANFGSLFSQHSDDFYQGKLQYGSQNVAQGAFETTGNIAPVETAQANVVIPIEPSKPSNTYSGVKGHRRPNVDHIEADENQNRNPAGPPSSTTFQPDLDSELVEDTTPVVVNQENLPWYKRFSNKVKQGALDLKNKIIG